jgi:putative nucleotidyltransferase with HDIG domain
VIVHCLQVERVALYLGFALNVEGEALDLHVVEAAALLHDITKIDGLQSGQNHALTAGTLIRKLGYPRVAEVVERHIMVPRGKLVGVTEEEIINYSDKRVMHDRIVTLEERFEDLIERYGKEPEHKALNLTFLERARELERKIFRRLPVRASELSHHLSGYPRLRL